MKAYYYFSFLLLGMLYSGCIPSTPMRIDAFRTPEFKPNATFKVVSLNSDDAVLALIEKELLVEGFKVIADNQLRTTSAPSGNVTITTRDTTYNTTQYRSTGMEMFKEKPSDYVIRYSAAWRMTGRFFDYFNVSVINTASGAVEFTYNFRQATYTTVESLDAESIVRDFVIKMRPRK